jgi:hypothetical protein
MKTIKIKKEVEYQVEVLKVSAGVRYWEDAIINGVEALEDGSNTPCVVNGRWELNIDVNNGQILNWLIGNTAKVHYKVCDDGIYTLLDKDRNQIIQKDDYVIDCLAIGDNGYGDYIILEINENGFIKDFNFDSSDFEDNED